MTFIFPFFVQDINLCAVFPDAEVLWPNFEESNSFFMCAGTTRFLMRCPANSLFSFGCQVCVWPWDWRQPPPVHEISPNLPPCIVDESTQTSTLSPETTTGVIPEETTTTDKMPPSPPEETTTIPGEETTDVETEPPVGETVSLNFTGNLNYEKIKQFNFFRGNRSRKQPKGKR